MFSIKRIWLKKDPIIYKQWLRLIEKAHLNPHESVDYTVGIFAKNELIATGSYEGSILKYLTVQKEYRSENLLTDIVTHLLAHLRENGTEHVFVYTTNCNKIKFQSLGFKEILSTDKILFMEQGFPTFKDYLALLQSKKKDTTDAAAIVMNANPFTKGHQYLTEYAASRHSVVYVFVVSEDRSEFTTHERIQMVTAGTAHINNVVILPTREYIVSNATFPAYFLKEKAQLDIAKEQAILDAKLFKQRIAPILQITTRYVGDEPYSGVTNLYNQTMATIFNDQIKLDIIPRFTIDGEIISATKVRKALQLNNIAFLKRVLPETSLQYIQQKNRGEH